MDSEENRIKVEKRLAERKKQYADKRIKNAKELEKNVTGG